MYNKPSFPGLLEDPYTVKPEDRQQALFQGLLAMGPQLMAAGAPSLQPGGGARGMANAGLAFAQGTQGHLNNARDRALGAYQIGRQKQSDARRDKMLAMEEEKAETAKANAAQQKSAIDAILAGDDNPVNRAWAMVDPSGFLKSKTTPKDPWAGTKVVGGNVVRPGEDGSVETIYSTPQKPEKETWGQPFEVTGQDNKPVLVRQSNLGRIEQVSGYTPKGSEKGGPFAGTGMDAQTYNILLQGDPGSPEYAAAFAYQAQPRTTFDPTTGKMITVNPDMSAFRAPGQQAAPQTAGVQTNAASVPQTNPAQASSSGQGNRGGVSVESVEGVTPKLSKDQSDAATYADRMINSHRILNTMDEVGADLMGTVTGNDYFPNALKSSDRQMMEQAQRDFVNAMLRRQSGAAISQEEFANAEAQYFPQPGDSPEVMAQKRANREADIQGLTRAAGPTYKPPGPIPSLPDVTEEDIRFTAEKYGLSRAEVIKRLTSPDQEQVQVR